MKKGFTLVELLVVIALIGLLVVIAIPSGLAVSKKVKQKMLTTKIELIESGAIVWGQQNKSEILKKDSNHCEIAEIVDDSKVTHCVRKSISELIEENALEADEERDGTKVLINPINDQPLNDCSLEIYIKNKRVYAKYDINQGGNCGYEDESDSDDPKDYKIKLLGEEEYVYTVFITRRMLSEYQDNSDLFDTIGTETFLANYTEADDGSHWSEPGFQLVDSNETTTINIEENNLKWDNEIHWNPEEKIYTFLYKIRDENDNVVTTKERKVKLNDESGPVIIYKHNGEIFLNPYDSGDEDDELDPISLRKIQGYKWELEPLKGKYYIFDNLDGITEISEEFDRIITGYEKEYNYELNLVDSSGNNALEDISCINVQCNGLRLVEQENGIPIPYFKNNTNFCNDTSNCVDLSKATMSYFKNCTQSDSDELCLGYNDSENDEASYIKYYLFAQNMNDSSYNGTCFMPLADEGKYNGYTEHEISQLKNAYKELNITDESMSELFCQNYELNYTGSLPYGIYTLVIKVRDVYGGEGIHTQKVNIYDDTPLYRSSTSDDKDIIARMKSISSMMETAEKGGARYSSFHEHNAQLASELSFNVYYEDDSAAGTWYTEGGSDIYTLIED